MSELRPFRQTGPAEGRSPDLADRIDQTLKSLPDAEIEARRAITRGFGFDPQGEELTAVMRLAKGAPTALTDRLSRDALELRLRAERLLVLVFEQPLRQEQIESVAPAIVELLNEAERFAESLEASIGALANAEARFLREVGETLMPSRDRLIAASVVAPKLALFAGTDDRDELRSATPFLSDEDARRISGSLAGDGSGRIRLNVLALRTTIQEDLASWEAIREGNTPGSTAAVARRLEQDRTAYLVVADQLQRRQDLALLAGLHELARDLRALKGELFSEYTRLASVLNGGIDPESKNAADAEQRRDLERVLEDRRAVEAIAEAQATARQTAQDVFLNAMTEPERRSRAALEGESPVRLRVLVFIAVVLFGVCIGIYAALGRASAAANPAIAPAVIATPIPVQRAVGIGPLMYVETDRETWDQWTPQERSAHVETLGAEARVQGFESLFLTDRDSNQLAIWNPVDGVILGH